jgi:hypothetical protein
MEWKRTTCKKTNKQKKTKVSFYVIINTVWYTFVIKKNKSWAGRVAQVVEHLPSKCEAEFRPGTAQNSNNKK